MVEARQQIVGIVGDLEEPLGQLALLDRRARAPAAPVDHLLVGEHGLVDRVPVDLRLLARDEAGVRGSRGTASAGACNSSDRRSRSRATSRATGPSTATAPAWRRYWRRSIPPDGVVLHGGVLGRQAERVPAHRMENVEPARAPIARHHVAHRVVAHMAHVDAPRRIGEHLEHVIFRARIVVLGLEDLRVRPGLAPFGLGFAHVVSFGPHCRGRTLGKSIFSACGAQITICKEGQMTRALPARAGFLRRASGSQRGRLTPLRRRDASGFLSAQADLGLWRRR